MIGLILLIVPMIVCIVYLGFLLFLYISINKMFL
ncbi:hypothetical protein BCD95_000373 [Clostridium beijerinckii]|uniref:Uncharacterized protein n=1 Tax=Clostridium beijerinckii TaxID=1520 RepID=A0AAE5EX52_CLOBE|nr:hypothetical protein [Clostridium beijerinckii]